MLRQIRQTAIKTVTTGVVVFGTLEVTTKLPSEGRSSEIYHRVSDEVVTPLLRKLLNPEDAHNMAIYSVRNGLGPKHHPNQLETSSKIDLSSKLTITPTPNTTQRSITNLTFPNCIGLAAGFDKDGVAISNLMELGFGFVEIGSVTPKPQPGNPKPRMFRLTEDGGVINRFGFNSVGMDVVEENLRRFYEGEGGVVGDDGGDSTEVEEWWMDVGRGVVRKVMGVLVPIQAPQPPSLLGVNLGKNKTSTEETEDYELGIQKLGPYADYLVINISSPNTPGLRDLQKNEPLKRLLHAAIRQRNNLLPKRQRHASLTTTRTLPPLFVKISPDNTDDELKNIAAIAMECNIDGILVTNTTNARPSTLQSPHSPETGGLSGTPLRDKSTECIRRMYHHTNGKIFIIGMGGVSSGHDVYDKLKAGASVVQMYSGLVYGGPGLVSRIRGELAEIMEENGQRCMGDVVGLDHEGIYWEKRLERTREMRGKEIVIADE